jgi:RNA recognition motif-containing protein
VVLPILLEWFHSKLNSYLIDFRGFGFVRFHDKRDASDAIKGMDGYEMDGRELREDYARHERHHLVADEMVLKCSRKQNDKRLTGDQEGDQE